jgi:predicted kinase
VNGPPGSGKSALTGRYVEDHPLTLNLEIDAIRMSLGGWEEHRESMALARTLALAMTETHLAGGNDVIIPQYVGRIAFIDALDELARRLGIEFVEILLMDTPAAVSERFRTRRSELTATGRAHPQGDVDDSLVDDVVAESLERLEAIRAIRPRTMVVEVGDSVEDTYRSLSETIRSRTARP